MLCSFTLWDPKQENLKRNKFCKSKKDYQKRKQNSSVFSIIGFSYLLNFLYILQLYTILTKLSSYTYFCSVSLYFSYFSFIVD